MFATTKKPLQVRMGKEKGLSILGSIALDNACYFELSQHNLN
jgi:hypothetical protein